LPKKSPPNEKGKPPEPNVGTGRGKHKVSKKGARYDAIISELFGRHHTRGQTSFFFDRTELEEIITFLNLRKIKNLGDILYTYRFRRDFPHPILETQDPGLEWAIKLAGRGRYRFRLGQPTRIVPRADMAVIKVPDSTPEIIDKYAQKDEQALLARVRYNRLVDIFLGIATYSLQNHLRTTVKDLGQIEIDELYVGVSRSGQQFTIPVQAKGNNDKLSSAQAEQDYAWSKERYPHLTCRPISAQFMPDRTIALFELSVDEESEVHVVEERHYRLVPHDQISDQDLQSYSLR
jgi:hypothetical protein